MRQGTEQKDGAGCDPEELFIEWLDGQEAGDGIPFEEWVVQHGDQEAELRRMHTDWCCFAPFVDAAVPGRLATNQAGELALLAGDDEAEEGSTQEPADLLDKLNVGVPTTARYKFRSVIGSGGGGVVLKVWDSTLQRDLAMKVVYGRGEDLRPGNTPRIDQRALTRFVDEARIIGQLDHPGIVPVHELGSDYAGRVFFTMKLVHGEDLARLMEQERRGGREWTQARLLAVLQRVGEAVAYAHDRGVIHRDLKPANVMVGSYGEVYVMDFGLAKVLAAAPDVTSARSGPLLDEVGATLLTADGEGVIGTPGYMPPEQARADVQRMDARSDVYALGAMLYELVSGRAPLPEGSPPRDLDAYLEWLREGCCPPLTEVAPEAAPELVSIAERAMARDVDERYQTMRELVDDVGAYLEGRVVRAHSAGAWAVARKWMLRNRALTAALAAGIFVLLSSSVLLSLKNEELKESLEDVSALLSFQDVMFRDLSLEVLGAAIERRQYEEMERLVLAPEHAGRLPSLDQVSAIHGAVNGSTVARAALAGALFEGALDRATSQFEDKPLLAAKLQMRLSATLMDLGLYDLAGKAAELAFQNRSVVLGLEHPDTLASRLNRAAAMWRRDRNPEAMDEAVEVYAGLLEAGESYAEEAIKAGNLLAVLKLEQGEIAACEELSREVLAAREAHSGPEHVGVAESLNQLAISLMNQGRLEEAHAPARRALELRRSVLGERDFRTLTSMGNLALILKSSGRLDEAEPIAREVLSGFEEIVGDDHGRTIVARNNLAALLGDLDRWEEAMPLYRQALETAVRVFGTNHPDTIAVRANLALELKRRGHFEEAEELYRQALDALNARQGPAGRDSLRALINLAMLLSSTGRHEEAVDLAREGVDLGESAFPDSDPFLLGMKHALGTILADSGRLDEAETCLRAVLEGRRALEGDHGPSVMNSTLGLAALLRLKEDPAGARELYQTSFEYHTQSRGADHSRTIVSLIGIVWSMTREGRFVAAAEVLEAHMERLAEMPSTRADSLTRVRETLLAVYRELEKRDPEGGYGAQVRRLEKLKEER